MASLHVSAIVRATKSATEIAAAEINKRYEAYEETERHTKSGTD